MSSVEKERSHFLNALLVLRKRNCAESLRLPLSYLFAYLLALSFFCVRWLLIHWQLYHVNRQQSSLFANPGREGCLHDKVQSPTDESVLFLPLSLRAQLCAFRPQQLVRCVVLRAEEAHNGISSGALPTGKHGIPNTCGAQNVVA